MARPLRIEYPDAVYHITSRGNARQPVFLEEGDCSGFLAALGEVVELYRWRCYAYCLMTNHYHLLIDTPELAQRPFGVTASAGCSRTYGRTPSWVERGIPCPSW